MNQFAKNMLLLIVPFLIADNNIDSSTYVKAGA